MRDTVSGSVRVIDGDTFDVGGTRVRLHAVDAPEMDQTCKAVQGATWDCGVWITKVVRDRFAGQIATCTSRDTDRYGRTVATCVVGGQDVGAWLVDQGMAFAYVKYGSDYVAQERVAARANRGLHATQIQAPEDHRRAKRKAAAAPSGECQIKGNISARGTRIYHISGQQFYQQTRISIRKGERWFCSQAAAQAAGWRAARR
ncbi:thermonuclease family protein [Sulfitobacter sp. SK012]|uniref:thermonuclease family protein n=1 Tax=Sulfitobacter sp. SK012 TaxID=1389005 RepID=UPI0034A0CC22